MGRVVPQRESIMFFHQEIRGNSLPPRTVCLTYDDGPGPSTRELAWYLYQERIPACFFVMGKHAAQYADTMASLRSWGHLVGNHTYSHPGLVDFALAGGDVVGEIVATHHRRNTHYIALANGVNGDGF